MKQILLFGARGQVGMELIRTLQLIGQTYIAEKGVLTQPPMVRELIQKLKPKLIVNAGAYTNVDKAEQEQDLAYTINAASPGVMAEEACHCGALLVHFSTDYVFDGRSPQFYTERDRTNPLNIYGKTKLVGEGLIQNKADRYLIFRLCWLYSTGFNNFVSKIREAAMKQEVLKVVDDQFGSPTWARLVAEATTLAAHRFEPKLSGIYHMAASDTVSWYEFAKLIVSQLSETLCREVVPIKAADLGRPAVRPANSGLDCWKLNDRFGIALPDWQLSYYRFLEEIRFAKNYASWTAGSLY